MGAKLIYTSMVYVRDAARSAVAALSARVKPGSVYQITDGERHTMDTLYDCIEEAFGKESKSKRVKVPFWLVTLWAWWLHDVKKVRGISPDQVRQFKGLYWYASNEKAIRELGWKPEMSFREGVRETVRWYGEHSWL